MTATLESEESDLYIMDVISCVAIFHEKRKSGGCFLRKEKVRAQLSQKVVSLDALKETVR